MSEPTDPPASPPVINYAGPGIPLHRWKTIWRAANPMEANLAVAELEERGLHARVDFENTAALGFSAYAPGGTAVQVMDDETAEARTVIDEMERRQRERLNTNSVSCPFCNAPGARRAIHRIRFAGIFTGFVGAVLGKLPLPIPPLVSIALVAAGVLMIFWPMQPYWQCAACAKHFHAPEPKAQEEEDEEEDDEPAEEEVREN